MAISHMLATVEDWIGQAVNMVVGVVAVFGVALCLLSPFIVVWGVAFVAWQFVARFW